jgi:hypothetical protein
MLLSCTVDTIWELLCLHWQNLFLRPIIRFDILLSATSSRSAVMSLTVYHNEILTFKKLEGITMEGFMFAYAFRD